MNLGWLTQDEPSGLFRVGEGTTRGKSGGKTCREAFVRGTKDHCSIGSVGV